LQSLLLPYRKEFVTLRYKYFNYSMALEIKVPAPGESVSEVTIANWLVKEGDWIEMDAPIAEFESDKATFEVNAEKSGVIEKLIGNIGDTIAINTVIAVINTDAAKPAGSANPAVASATETNTVDSTKKETKESATAGSAVASSTAASATSTATNSSINTADLNASPIALQLIQQYQLDPKAIKGTGANGKITKVDVLEAIVTNGKGLNTGGSTNANSSNSKYHTSNREPKREKMSNLRKTVSRRLVAAKNETAMLTTFNEVNMKPVMDLRGQYKKKFEETHGVGLGFMSFFTRLAGKARDNKLSLEEMTGGTFTITNGGVFGSMMSTPIINPPQSGILGMHNIVERPVVENGQIVIRPMMYLALSYDHRIIDGRESVSFLVRVKQLLENPEMLFDGKRPEETVLGF